MERRLTDRITEFELANGLHFIVMERHNAPIVSVHTYANVGAFDEVAGQTGRVAHQHSDHCPPDVSANRNQHADLKGHVHAGIAHLLEHMAFKGSVRLGTKDYQREAALLNSADEGAALFHAMMILVLPAYRFIQVDISHTAGAHTLQQFASFHLKHKWKRPLSL